MIKHTNEPVPSLDLKIPTQRAYLQASGLSVSPLGLFQTIPQLEDLDNLKIVHVAGSKGKGSVCTYIESVFRHEGYRTGLITWGKYIPLLHQSFRSPHLINVEERMLINGKPLDKDVFAEYFWLIYDKFKENAVWMSPFIYES